MTNTDDRYAFLNQFVLRLNNESNSEFSDRQIEALNRLDTLVAEAELTLLDKLMNESEQFERKIENGTEHLWAVHDWKIEKYRRKIIAQLQASKGEGS